METDWEVEIADDAPIIDAAWSGYLDLRSQPDRVNDIAEVAQLPALGRALLRLNSPDSPVWTAKCDVWQIDSIDPDEMNTDLSGSGTGIACYLDLLPAEPNMWITVEGITVWCRELCLRLRSAPVQRCRVDLIIRRAFHMPEQPALGITAYIAGCGASETEAAEALSAATEVFSKTASTGGKSIAVSSNYNGNQTGE